MKKVFLEPEVDVVVLNENDVIVTSTCLFIPIQTAPDEFM